MTSPVFLSLDVGTTAVKAGVFGVDGTAHSVVSREYELETPKPNIVELDPEVYWLTSIEAVRAALNHSGVKSSDVVSVGVCSQGETLICLDSAGTAIRNAIVWMDNRSHQQAEQIRAHLGVFPQTGQTDLDPCWPITKILWLKQYEPDVFSRTERFMLVEDFIVYRLCGKFVGDFSLYSSSYMIDVERKEWLDDILDYVGVEKSRLVELLDSGCVVGEVTSDAAETLSIPKSTKVVSGAMDLAASLVGTGNTRPGVVTEITGAAQIVCNTLDRVPETRSKTMAVQCHAVPGAYLMIGWCPSGGMSLRWFRDTFSPGSDFEKLTDSARAIAPGSDGLHFFPYQSGPGTLDIASHIRGCWYGLELNHTAGHFVRSILEAIAYVDRQNLDDMRASGFEYREIRAIGGGASSRLWNQIKANVIGRNVTTMCCSESAMLGVVILQAVALEYFGSIDEAAAVMVKSREVVTPQADATDEYDRLFMERISLQDRLMGSL